MQKGYWTLERVLLVTKPFFGTADVPSDLSNGLDPQNQPLQEENYQDFIREGSIQIKLNEFISNEEIDEVEES